MTTPVLYLDPVKKEALDAGFHAAFGEHRNVIFPHLAVQKLEAIIQIIREAVF